MVDIAHGRCHHSWLPTSGNRFDISGGVDPELTTNNNDPWQIDEREIVDTKIVKSDQPQLMKMLIPSIAKLARLLRLSDLTDSPDVVLKYLIKHRIEDGVAQTVEMAKTFAPLGSNIAIYISDDHESDEDSLVINVDMDADWSTAFDIHQNFARKWVRTVATALQERVRLTFTAR